MASFFKLLNIPLEKKKLPLVKGGLLSGAFDLQDQYNTLIPEKQKDEIDNLLSLLPEHQRNSYDYDIQGALLDGLSNNNPSGHFSDKYKKPNHPTFSDQSIYNGIDGLNGGSWYEIFGRPVFKPSDTNLDMNNPEWLRKYFNKVEGTNATLLYDLKDILKAFPEFNK